MKLAKRKTILRKKIVPNLNVVKQSGKVEPFSRHKLNLSLKRTGLNHYTCRRIADQVMKQVKNGTTTKEIYRRAFKLVKSESSLAAIHYSLKRAIVELGPSGFEFERFVAKYFNQLGYETITGKTLQGQFVTHEVDVIGIDDTNRFFAECKFHNHVESKNDIKVALYVKARWDDLKNGPEGKSFNHFYLVSNTAFSKDAITYSDGVGLKLLGLNAPVGNSFLDQVKKMKLYPITSLKRLKKGIKDMLLAEKVLLCSELQNKSYLLKKMRMSEEEINLIMHDIAELLQE